MPINSFPAVIDENCKVLILGTMPGVKSLEQQEYYAHPQNQLWKILCEIFNCDTLPSTFPEKRKFLLENNIAVWDVLESCEREGSLDSKIRNHLANDIPKMLTENSTIQKIIFNGKESNRLYERNFGKPLLPYFIMPSTSPAYTLKYADKLALWKMAFND